MPGTFKYYVIILRTFRTPSSTSVILCNLLANLHNNKRTYSESFTFSISKVGQDLEILIKFLVYAILLISKIEIRFHVQKKYGIFLGFLDSNICGERVVPPVVKIGLMRNHWIIWWPPSVIFCNHLANPPSPLGGLRNIWMFPYWWY